MIRWSAHVALLFTELPLLERFGAAARAGFARAECWSPFEHDLEEFALAVERSGLALAGFNLESGDMAAGERGFLNLEERRDAVLENARAAVALAQRLGARNVNALAGNAVGEDRDAERDVVAARLRELARLARGTDVTFLVEPVNAIDSPRYLVPTPDDAARLIARVDDPAVGMLLDVFHTARAGLDVVAEIERHGELIRHVHVADAPGRHEPGSGAIDFAAVFSALERISYDGSVGLEYAPSGSTGDSLGWLPREQRGESQQFPAATAAPSR